MKQTINIKITNNQDSFFTFYACLYDLHEISVLYPSVWLLRDKETSCISYGVPPFVAGFFKVSLIIWLRKYNYANHSLLSPKNWNLTLITWSIISLHLTLIFFVCLWVISHHTMHKWRIDKVQWNILCCTWEFT